MNKIWMRAGATLSVTETEADDIIGSCGDEGGDAIARRETLNRVIKEGRFAFDGESYVPGICISEYNRVNDTNYDDYDVETDLDIPASEISAFAANQSMAIYALIENWSDAGNDSVGENVLLFSDYDSALAQYKATLAAEREDGILARWGENAIIDEGDDYICVTDPKVNNYAGYHYKLYIERKQIVA